MLRRMSSNSTVNGAWSAASWKWYRVRWCGPATVPIKCSKATTSGFERDIGRDDPTVAPLRLHQREYHHQHAEQSGADGHGRTEASVGFVLLGATTLHVRDLGIAQLRAMRALRLALRMAQPATGARLRAAYQPWRQKCSHYPRLPLSSRFAASRLNNHRSSPPWHRYFNSRYSSRPCRDPSRPMPDCLMPPNGATSVETTPSLMPTMPYSRPSATRQIRPTSRA